MDCPCASANFKPASARHTDNHDTLVLDYSVCQGCGRVGEELLRHGQALLLKGTAARVAYRAWVDSGAWPALTEQADLSRTDDNNDADVDSQTSESDELVEPIGESHWVDKWVSRSIWNPYKLLITPAGTFRHLQIRTDDDYSILAIPALDIVTEGTDHVEVTLDSCRQLRERLQLAPGEVAVTCTTPFKAEWGSQSADDVSAPQHSEDTDTSEDVSVNDEPPPTTEPEPQRQEPEIATKVPDPINDQMDLFG